MTEEWRIIREFPNYEVSNHGQVRCINSNEILSGGTIDGYKRVKLTNKNLYPVPKDKRIHLLVAAEFIPNPDPSTLTQVHHIDFNKKNNTVPNLMWVTNNYNNDSVNKPKRTNIRSPFTKEEVLDILMAKGTLTGSQLAEKHKCGVKAINSVWVGKNKNSKIWLVEYLKTIPPNMNEFDIPKIKSLMLN